MAELILWLDNYGDIYSDFDARALLKRRISEDFIQEMEAAHRRREDNIDCLVLQVPEAVRIETDEKLITERLTNYFHREYELSHQQLKKNTRKNLLFLGISILAMSTNIAITLRTSAVPGGIIALRVLLEPAGWFFFWNSLEYFFYKRSAESGKVKFWNTAAGWKILFRSY